MGFCLSRDVAPGGMGDWVAIPGRFKPVLDKTLLERLDVFRGHVRRGSHVGVGPST
jgi:hypothetical protein